MAVTATDAIPKLADEYIELAAKEEALRTRGRGD
jgi:hypothetical protein